MALTVGVDHLVPVESGLPWHARTNFDLILLSPLILMVIACMAVLAVLQRWAKALTHKAPGVAASNNNHRKHNNNNHKKL